MLFVIPTGAQRSGGTCFCGCYDAAMEHEYFVDMVASRSRTLYIGVTRNLAVRVGQHKVGSVEGFTADYLCTRLVWFERHQYVRNPILREKQMKRWRREKKVWLIERDNPTWEDLAAGWRSTPMQFCE